MEAVKEFLMQINNIDLEVESLKEQLQQITAVVEGGSISYGERIQTTKTNNREDKIIKMIESKERLEKLICDRLETVVVVNDMLNKLDGSLACILRERYCNSKDWNYISNKFKYSNSKIYKLHNKALRELKKILIEEGINLKGNESKRKKK